MPPPKRPPFSNTLAHQGYYKGGRRPQVSGSCVSSGRAALLPFHDGYVKPKAPPKAKANAKAKAMLKPKASSSLAKEMRQKETAARSQAFAAMVKAQAPVPAEPKPSPYQPAMVMAQGCAQMAKAKAEAKAVVLVGSSPSASQDSDGASEAYSDATTLSLTGFVFGPIPDATCVRCTFCGYEWQAMDLSLIECSTCKNKPVCSVCKLGGRCPDCVTDAVSDPADRPNVVYVA